jgi:uncharacterized membrane protein
VTFQAGQSPWQADARQGWEELTMNWYTMHSGGFWGMHSGWWVFWLAMLLLVWFIAIRSVQGPRGGGES